jgi:hypothetical protein
MKGRQNDSGKDECVCVCVECLFSTAVICFAKMLLKGTDKCKVLPVLHLGT